MSDVTPPQWLTELDTVDIESDPEGYYENLHNHARELIDAAKTAQTHLQASLDMARDWKAAEEDRDALKATNRELVRCLRYARCDVCGGRYGHLPDRCYEAGHIEAHEAVAKAQGQVDE